MKKSMNDVAYKILSSKKKSVAFDALWKEVVLKMEYSETEANRKLVQFYNNIMLDNRFVSVEQNKWDLRERRKFEEIHIDTSAIIIEDDENEDEVELIFEEEIETQEKDDSGY